MDDDGVPEGYQWVPAREVPSNGWELVDSADSRPCRYTVGPARATCKQPSAARLFRGGFPAGDGRNWWHYCEEHLFGQRIRHGVLEACVRVDWEEQGRGE